ncbi:ubiquitin carboxyl-terminal hydrolase 1 [Eupeodes corollae]|uniref:ubiquitin carboxyl-terminal hydrolase 1 n=1 Tax=Eupeodes corollae TaxID=290404 RepID=UPI0024921A52|nr:ubiquitin carboxyl-terminal hydrolase 1 [Eupeodes corollae]
MSITVPKPKDEEEHLPTEQLITSSLNLKTQQTEPKQNTQLISSDFKQRKALLSLKHSTVTQASQKQLPKKTVTTFKCKNILTLSNNTNQKNKFQETSENNAQTTLIDDISIVTETASSSLLSTSKTSAERYALRTLNKIPSFFRRKKTYGGNSSSDTIKENCLVPGACSNDHSEKSEKSSIRNTIETKITRTASKLSLSFNPLAGGLGGGGGSVSGVKRPADTTLSSTSSEAVKPKKLRTMSMYDRQYTSSDDRPITNGYLSSRNSSAGHNDDNNVLTNANNYYSSSATLSSGANGGSNAILHAPSMASLCNIGNTCYLNSVVYTLRFAPLFLHNLHHLVVDLANIQQNIGKNRAKSSSLGRNISGMHMENARSWSSKDLASLENYGQCETQKSSQQVATEKLHDLYKSLHHNEISETTEPFHADKFLHAIQEVSAIFEGNQQQDAHEFLMCVLDSIRETCQTLIKSISDCPDVIINGCVSLPEHITDSPPEQNHINHSSSVINNNNNNNNNNSSSNSTSSSKNATNIIKTSFFTRKPKRKDEAKNAKNQRLQSPLKDNVQQQQQQLPQLYTQSFGDGVAINSGSVFGNSGSDKIDSKNASPSGDDEVMPIKDKERLAEKIKKLGLDFFTEDFEGMTVSTTKCLSCETVTEQKETMIDIAVPVPISGYTDTSNSFIQNSCITREYFREKNKYRCEQCTGYTEAIRSISYEVLPRLLVIQLSRFSGGMEKINSFIPTPFTMQCFCAKCEQRDSNNKLHSYKLYSVITHVGATMSVGHYIAYTCSLDWASDYINCPKDKRRHQTCNGSPNSSSSAAAPPRPPPSSSSSLSTSTGLIKKIKFGRNKASSSGDMSKSNTKNLNGQTSKSITNGIEKLSMNTTCHSVDCCASRLRTNNSRSSSYSSSSNSYSNGPTRNGGWSDLVDESSNQPQTNGAHNNSSYSYMLGHGSTGRSKSNSSSNAEPIWYMCDDDKIKAMTQREFEELLSPIRKITITPYLLFYARFDLQKQSVASDCGM